MIAAPHTAAGNAAGDALADALVLHAVELGVQGIIWARREWYASRSGAAWEDYAGPEDHRDHVHIELSPDAAAMSADEMRARLARVGVNSGGGGGGGGMGLLVLGALLAWLARRGGA